jgi:RHS repeat-associated protein
MYDEVGQLAWKMQLDIFGVPRFEAGTAEDCPWRWPGQYEDGGTGLSSNRFRYFDATLGRYSSGDPLELLSPTPRYSYVFDSTLFTDPLGLAPTCPVTGLPILEVSRTGPMPTIAQNIENDLAARGVSELQLSRVTPTQRDANRAAALAGRGSAPAGSSWDEFPFASSNLGGSGASVMAVPVAEQNVQGGTLNAFYRANGITPGSSFIVRVVP